MTTETSTVDVQVGINVSDIQGGIKDIAEKVGLEEGLATVTDKLKGAVSQDTKDYISETTGDIINVKYFRSFKEFFGIGEEKPFYLEKEKALIYERVQKNFNYFYLNYGTLAVILFCTSIFFDLGNIFHLVALAIAWAVVIKFTASGSFTFKNFSVSQKEATVVMTVISFFVLLSILKDAFWYAFFTSGVIMGVHAVLRDTTSLIGDQPGFAIPGDVGEGSKLLINT